MGSAVLNRDPKSFASSSINLNLTNAYLQLFRVYDEVLEKLTILNDNLPEKHYVVDQELTLYAFGDIPVKLLHSSLKPGFVI